MIKSNVYKKAEIPTKGTTLSKHRRKRLLTKGELNITIASPRRRTTVKTIKFSMMLEDILSRENMTQAYKRVKSNGGSAGIDGMSTKELKAYLVFARKRIFSRGSNCYC